MTINQEQVEKVLGNILKEHLDGFVLVGFIAGANTPVAIVDIPDPKTGLAVNAQLAQIVCMGGVSINPKQQ